jgi:hypothetical protein
MRDIIAKKHGLTPYQFIRRTATAWVVCASGDTPDGIVAGVSGPDRFTFAAVGEEASVPFLDVVMGTSYAIGANGKPVATADPTQAVAKALAAHRLLLLSAATATAQPINIAAMQASLTAALAALANKLDAE